jgi:hypothetical protein
MLRAIIPFVVVSGDPPLRLDSEGHVTTPEEFEEQSDRAAGDETHSDEEGSERIRKSGTEKSRRRDSRKVSLHDEEEDDEEECT